MHLYIKIMENKLETEIIMAESVLGKKLFSPKIRSHLLTMAEANKENPEGINELRIHFGDRIDLIMATVRFLEDMRDSTDIVSTARNIGQLDLLRTTAESLDYDAPVYDAPADYTTTQDLVSQLHLSAKTFLKIEGIQPEPFVSKNNPRQLELYLKPEDVEKIRQTLNQPPSGWKSVYKICVEIAASTIGKIGYKAILDALDVMADLIPKKIGRFTRRNNIYCDAGLAAEIMDCRTEKDLEKLIAKYR